MPIIKWSELALPFETLVFFCPAYHAISISLLCLFDFVSIWNWLWDRTLRTERKNCNANEDTRKFISKPMEWGDEKKMSLDLLLYENSELIWHIPGAVQFDVPFLCGLQRSTQDFFFICVYFFSYFSHYISTLSQWIQSFVLCRTPHKPYLIYKSS